MKVLSTGATGFVGGALLKKLTARPDIEEVTCLARRALEPWSPKIAVIVHDDFARYDASLLERLGDHTACIWALGGKASDLRQPEVRTDPFPKN
jgi:uncharacterized protein YbjT (DUF2867 family)